MGAAWAGLVPSPWTAPFNSLSLLPSASTLTISCITAFLRCAGPITLLCTKSNLLRLAWVRSLYCSCVTKSWSVGMTPTLSEEPLVRLKLTTRRCIFERIEEALLIWEAQESTAMDLWSLGASMGWPAFRFSIKGALSSPTPASSSSPLIYLVAPSLALTVDLYLGLIVCKPISFLFSSPCSSFQSNYYSEIWGSEEVRRSARLKKPNECYCFPKFTASSPPYSTLSPPLS